MAELKFISPPRKQGDSPAAPCCPPKPPQPLQQPAWVTGTIESGCGTVRRIATELSAADRLEHIRCRVSAFRDDYIIQPGLYAVGTPGRDADVMVSANYKLSFDHLRRSLSGLDVWVLVLDTRGINVWCAAGKGTFGTDELIKRLREVQLDRVVGHRRLILPQLGAPGVSGHAVLKATGFKVHFGPVLARDIRAFISAGHRASREMRTVPFTFVDRLVLTPMELNPALRKYYPWFGAAILLLFGLKPQGIMFSDAWSGGWPFLLHGLVAILAGAFATPLMLPLLPFRSFAIKGWIAGLAATAAALQFLTPQMLSQPLQLSAALLFFPMASSYVALQFTGSTTFTGMSGVKKELKLSLPVYLVSSAVSLAILLFMKLGDWGVL